MCIWRPTIPSSGRLSNSEKARKHQPAKVTRTRVVKTRHVAPKRVHTKRVRARYNHVVVGGQSYYRHHNQFYKRTFRRGVWRYVAIPTPIGARVSALPGHKVVKIGRRVYHVHNGRYFVKKYQEWRSYFVAVKTPTRFKRSKRTYARRHVRGW